MKTEYVDSKVRPIGIYSKYEIAEAYRIQTYPQLKFQDFFHEIDTHPRDIIREFRWSINHFLPQDMLKARSTILGPGFILLDSIWCRIRITPPFCSKIKDTLGIYVDASECSLKELSPSEYPRFILHISILDPIKRNIHSLESNTICQFSPSFPHWGFSNFLSGNKINEFASRSLIIQIKLMHPYADKIEQIKHEKT